MNGTKKKGIKDYMSYIAFFLSLGGTIGGGIWWMSARLATYDHNIRSVQETLQDKNKAVSSALKGLREDIKSLKEVNSNLVIRVTKIETKMDLLLLDEPK